ncbi:MAG: hypothetical protein JKY56_06940 [Kofleriaceae bacterium]|nr:hypothetical protein [Kofleriaceae bacterium]
MNSAKQMGLSLSLGALLLASACGGGGGDVKLEDLGTEVADTICSDQVKCGAFPDKASCIESTKINVDQLIAEVEAGLVTYDSSKAGECLDSLGGTDCTIFGSDQQENEEACDATFAGTIAIGGACITNESCAGEARCDQSNDETCTPGVCIANVQEVDAKEGESCANLSCESGLRCDGSDICQPPTAAAAVCSSVEECVSGYICELGPDFTPGTCVKLPTSGETCDPAFGGEFFGGRISCLKSTDYCDPSDTTCKGKLSVGDACPAGLEFACVNYAVCVEATCTAKPRIGESCVDDSALGCLGGLNCENSVCAADPAPAVCTL